MEKILRWLFHHLMEMSIRQYWWWYSLPITKSTPKHQIYHRTEIPFQDILLKNENCKISADIYHKSMDT